MDSDCTKASGCENCQIKIHRGGMAHRNCLWIECKIWKGKKSHERFWAFGLSKWWEIAMLPNWKTLEERQLWRRNWVLEGNMLNLSANMTRKWKFWMDEDTLSVEIRELGIARNKNLKVISLLEILRQKDWIRTLGNEHKKSRADWLPCAVVLFTANLYSFNYFSNFCIFS